MCKQIIKAFTNIITVLAVSIWLPFATVEARPNPFAAHWDGWENLGGSTFAAPECVSTKANSIDCFTIGFGGQIFRTAWNGTTWSAPQPVNGVMPSNTVDTTNPSTHTPILLKMECVSWGPDHIDCFTKDTDNILWRRSWDGTYDGGWEKLPGMEIGSVPDCVSTAARHLDCFARAAASGDLVHIGFDGDRWSEWQTYAANIIAGAKPECVAYINNRIECIVVYSGQHLRHFSVRNPGRGFVALGGSPTYAVAGWAPQTPVCRNEAGTDRLACFSPTMHINPATGSGYASFMMWTYDPTADNWGIADLASDYGQSYSSQATSIVDYGFDCLMMPTWRIHCMEMVVREPSQFPPASPTTLLRQVVWDQYNFTYSGWINYIPPTAPSPAPKSFDCVSWGGGRLDCFGGSGGTTSTPLWHTWFVPAHPLFGP